jgi:hypothetical protein
MIWWGRNNTKFGKIWPVYPSYHKPTLTSEGEKEYCQSWANWNKNYNIAQITDLIMMSSAEEDIMMTSRIPAIKLVPNVIQSAGWQCRQGGHDVDDVTTLRATEPVACRGGRQYPQAQVTVSIDRGLTLGVTEAGEGSLATLNHNITLHTLVGQLPHIRQSEI